MLKIDSAAHLAAVIDHTVLKLNVSPKEVENACQEAKTYHFAGVCVRPQFLPIVAKLLKETRCRAITVLDFPQGQESIENRRAEAFRALEQGAQELDLVMNYRALKERNFLLTFDGIASVVQVAGPIPVKVILETAALSEEEKVMGCAIAAAAGAKFVKTSTGFGPGGATVQDVTLLRRCVGTQIGVKASGGIRLLRDAMQMINAGANRMGTSSGVSLIQEFKGGSYSDDDRSY